jgi:hypothetical protein
MSLFRRDCVWMFILALLFSMGCEQEVVWVEPPSGSGGEDGWTPPPPPSQHVLTESAKFDWQLPTEALVPNPDCQMPSSINPATNEDLPWYGWIHKGVAYTCNGCPGGESLINGRWRFTPNVDDVSDTTGYEGYREVLLLDGNRFQMHIDGQDLGEPLEAVIEGWYFCGRKPEVPNQTKVFVVTGVYPEGAYGWETGLAFTVDTLMAGINELLFLYYLDVDTESTFGDASAPFCRIGSEIGGVVCEDPFGS